MRYLEKTAFRILRTVIATGVMVTISGNEAPAEVVSDLAPIVYDTETPDLLYLSGTIDIRTPVLLSQALGRYPDIRTLVISSPGGSVYAALAMSYNIRLTGLKTHIEADGSCTSACAYLFFAGAERTAEGPLGVHQLSSGSDSLAAGQVALADIIKAYSDFNVPAQVLNRMLMTTADEMFMFRPNEMTELGLIGVTVTAPEGTRVALLGQVAEAEARAAKQVDDSRSLEERLAAALAARMAAESTVEAFYQKVGALRRQLAELQSLLDDAKERDLAAEVRLQNIGSDLNAAIARVAQEERRRRIAEEEKRMAEEAKRKLEEERAGLLEAVEKLKACE
jgi:ATP-dependent protease ClpP protease subunit